MGLEKHRRWSQLRRCPLHDNTIRLCGLHPECKTTHTAWDEENGIPSVEVTDYGSSESDTGEGKGEESGERKTSHGRRRGVNLVCPGGLAPGLSTSRFELARFGKKGKKWFFVSCRSPARLFRNGKMNPSEKLHTCQSSGFASAGNASSPVDPPHSSCKRRKRLSQSLGDPRSHRVCHRNIMRGINRLGFILQSWSKGIA